MQNFISVEWDVDSFAIGIFVELVAAVLPREEKSMAFNKRNRLFGGKPRIFAPHSYAGTITLTEERLTDSGSLMLSLFPMSSRWILMPPTIPASASSCVSPCAKQPSISRQRAKYPSES